MYIWADGIYFNIRMEHNRTCILVLLGATESGEKEILAIADGYRESEQSWISLLLDLQSRGWTVPPKLAIGDGAMVYKLGQGSHRGFQRLNGSELMRDVIAGVVDEDGVIKSAA
ncbi:MAG: transposase [Phycisphaerae bacterium]|nr:transposase [Phycisphaerae bacterium]